MSTNSPRTPPMPTNKPEVVLPDWAIAAAYRELDNCQNHSSKECHAYNKVFNRALELHRADTLTRPADGEFHECPHCKGWSRTTPPAIDIGKLRENTHRLVAAAAAVMPAPWKFGAHVPFLSEKWTELGDAINALIGDGGEKK